MWLWEKKAPVGGLALAGKRRHQSGDWRQRGNADEPMTGTLDEVRDYVRDINFDAYGFENMRLFRPTMDDVIVE